MITKIANRRIETKTPIKLAYYRHLLLLLLHYWYRYISDGYAIIIWVFWCDIS